jgi:hypothetical protein
VPVIGSPILPPQASRAYPGSKIFQATKSFVESPSRSRVTAWRLGPAFLSFGPDDTSVLMPAVAWMGVVATSLRICVARSKI